MLCTWLGAKQMRAAGKNSAVVVRAKLVGWLRARQHAAGRARLSPPARGVAAGVAESPFGPPEHGRSAEAGSAGGLPVRAEPAAARAAPRLPLPASAAAAAGAAGAASGRRHGEVALPAEAVGAAGAAMRPRRAERRCGRCMAGRSGCVAGCSSAQAERAERGREHEGGGHGGRRGSVVDEASGRRGRGRGGRRAGGWRDGRRDEDEGEAEVEVSAEESDESGGRAAPPLHGRAASRTASGRAAAAAAAAAHGDAAGRGPARRLTLTPQHLYVAYVWYLNRREHDARGGAGDEEHVCLMCKDGGDMMLCDFRDGECGKSYHSKCLSLRAPPEGVWECPRHRCGRCGVGPSRTDAQGRPRTPDPPSEATKLWACRTCPKTFCTRCLSPDTMHVASEVRRASAAAISVPPSPPPPRPHPPTCSRTPLPPHRSSVTLASSCSTATPPSCSRTYSRGRPTSSPRPPPSSRGSSAGAPRRGSAVVRSTRREIGHPTGARRVRQGPCFVFST